MVLARQRFKRSVHSPRRFKMRTTLMAAILGLSLLVVAGPAAAETPLTVGSAATYDLVAGPWNNPPSTVPVSGGTAPYAFTVIGGQLPPGVTLSADGTFQGTPTATGLFHATVQVTDAAGSGAAGNVAVPVVSIQTVSARPDGSIGGSSNSPSVSDDGNRIAFLTYDSVLLQGAPAPQVVVREYSPGNPSGDLVIASSTSTGTPSTGASLGSAVISHNGRYVLIGTNQWAPDGQNPGFWLKDIQTSELRLVVNEASNPSLTISPGAISDDGTIAVIQDQSSSGNPVLDVVDLTTSPYTVTKPALCPNDGGTESPRMTPDGRYVVFEEVSACGQAGYHVEVLDRTTSVVSEVGNRSIGSYVRQADISADGRYVAFWSDMESGFSPGTFVFDRTANAPVPVPAPPINPGGHGNVWLSGDGSRVALEASQGAICAYDRPAQTTSCFDSGATDPRWQMSGDGKTIVFNGAGYDAIYSLRLPISPITRQTYVALGDSYSSGEGAPNPGYIEGTDVKDNRCHRSTAAYPERIASIASNTYPDFIFRACSGAKIEDFFSAKVKDAANEPFQLHWLDGKTGLVTLTIGGNDLRFRDVMKYCAWRRLDVDPSCQSAFSQTVENNLNRISNTNPRNQDTLASLFRSIKAGAKNIKKVLIVGYPRLFPTSPPATCGTGILGRLFERSDMLWLNRQAVTLDTALRHAADAAGFEFVDTYGAFDGFELCTPHTYVNRAIFSVRNSIQNWSFHPNVAGQAAITRLVAAHL